MTPAKLNRTVLWMVWLAIATAGGVWLMAYDKQLGAQSVTPVAWPAPSYPALHATRDTLILFAHPHCPCSRASLEELNRVLAGRAQNISAHVLFLKPSGVSSSWTQSRLRKSAEAIEPIQVADDLDGEIARRFGVETSGYVVLYSPDGKLLFAGGITEGRGHVGDNSSKTALIERLSRRASTPIQTPVFGCSLQCSENALPSSNTTQ